MKNRKKVALITAGASGIGQVIAELFLANQWNVHICDINQAEDLSEKLPNAKFLKIKNAGHDAKDVKKELIDATNSII